LLCVRTAFGQIQLNLLWTTCIHTPSVDEQLRDETFPGYVNGCTDTDMSDGLFTCLFEKINGMSVVFKIIKYNLQLKILEVLRP